MYVARTGRSQRPGFTLVELMVVILIISILSALLTMAVTQGIKKAKVTRNMVDLRNLAASVDAFKTFYKVDHIPSKIFLSEKGNYNTGVPILADSLGYLLRIWPKLQFPVDWNGNSFPGDPNNPNPTVANPSGDMLLEGDQCLVFFLGGIPSQDPVTLAWSCTGFSTNPSNPAAHILNAGPVKGPFYEFDSSRLVNLPHPINPAAPRMLSYLDTYGSSDGKGNRIDGMPYLYFSNYGSRNGYNRYLTNASDCNPMNLALQKSPVFPYAQGVNQYLNPTGFQIISAGADKIFGPGTVDPTSTKGGPFWTSAAAASSAASGPNGADDQSNFYDNLLGTPSIN